MSVNEEHLVTDAMPDAPRVSNIDKPIATPIPDVHKTEPSKTGENVTPEITTEKIKLTNITSSSKPKKRIPHSTKTSHASSKVINIMNSSGVHVGNVNNFHFNPNNNKQKPETNKNDNFQDENVDKMLSNNAPVTIKDIKTVSTHLGNGWRNVGKNLLYSDGQMDQFFENNKRNGIKEVIYKMLLDWIQVKPDESKIKDLGQALLDADEKEVILLWAKTI